MLEHKDKEMIKQTKEFYESDTTVNIQWYVFYTSGACLYELTQYLSNLQG